MHRPPFVGRVLLRALVPASHREYVAGDLLEESRTTKAEQLGPAGANRWYVWQAARSAWPFLLLRLRRGEFLTELAVAQLLVIGTLVALEAVWGFVLGQVPLRAAAVAPGLQIAGLAASGLAAGVVGFACRYVGHDGYPTSPLALCAFVVVGALVLGGGIGVPHVGLLQVTWYAGLAAVLGSGVLAGAALASRTPGRRLHAARVITR